ncbi:MAG: type II secretion system protein GspD, partial [Gammaproteobacteria bacterium]|nr:type II secretion system protein GspD [Gammaproteobacteria bacterium]
MRLLSQLLGLTLAASLALVPAAAIAEEEFSASFMNTEIAEFIQSVSRNLEETIIIDPEVRGRINVRSYNVMSRDQYYAFFLNVLEVYGFAVVRMDNGVLKVIRERDARTKPTPVVDDDSYSGDEWVTRVIAVQNVSVRELGPLLRQLNEQAKGGAVMTYDPSNVIMLSGRAELLNRLVDIIRRVDQAGNQDVEVVQLQHSSAAEMVRIAQAVFQQQGSNVPEMLVPRIVPDERTNRVLISGEPRARERAIRLIKQLDTEMETTGNTRVYYLRYAKANEMVDLLRGMTQSILAEQRSQSGSGQSAQAAPRGRTGTEISIEAHEPTNALVITAQPDMLRALEGVINQLDIRRAQVLVEAIIVEVFEGDGVNFGIQWVSEDIGMMQHSNGQMVPIGQLGIAAEAARTQRGAETERVDNAGNRYTTREPDRRGDYTMLASLLGNANGLLMGTVQDGWAAVIQAVATTTNSNILSAPSITTLDNNRFNQ